MVAPDRSPRTRLTAVLMAVLPVVLPIRMANVLAALSTKFWMRPLVGPVTPSPVSVHAAPVQSTVPVLPE